LQRRHNGESIMIVKSFGYRSGDLFRRSSLFILTGILVLLFVIPVYAQGEAPQPPTDDEVNAVAKQLYCPVCENIPLDVCPTQACAEWRELIRLKLSEGWTDEQIKEYFVEQYGDRVLATPPPTGFNWLAYIVPPIGVLIGVFLLFKAFKSLRLMNKDDGIEIFEDEVDNEYAARLEEELRKR